MKYTLSRYSASEAALESKVITRLPVPADDTSALTVVHAPASASIASPLAALLPEDPFSSTRVTVERDPTYAMSIESASS